MFRSIRNNYVENSLKNLTRIIFSVIYTYAIDMEKEVVSDFKSRRFYKENKNIAELNIFNKISKIFI